MGARAAGFSAEARVARVEVVHQGQEVTDQCHPVHGLLGRQAQQPEALPCGAGAGQSPEPEGEANVRGRGGGHRDRGDYEEALRALRDRDNHRGRHRGR